MRKKIFWAALCLLMLNAVLLYGQGEPCGGADPDAVCPLDTWVFVLGGAALIFASFQLYKKQKSPLPMAEGNI